MKRLYIVSIVLLSFVWASCYDDKGNYDYTELTKTEIKGIQTEYSKISFKDTLYINPEITPATEEYEYLWTLNTAYEQMPAVGGFETDTISQEKNLAYSVDLPKGIYDVTLKVTNKATGHAIFHQTSLVAQTEFSLGFYVLKEQDGHTDVDLHLPDGGIAEQLITKSTGHAMAGSPRSLGMIFQYCFMNEEGEYEAPSALSVCTDQDVQIFNLQDMGVMFSYQTMFFGEVPTGETPYYVYPNCYGIAYASDKGMYFNSQYAPSQMFSAGKFGYSIPVSDAKSTCHPNPNIIYDGIESSGGGNTYLYDELNHRFLAFDFNGAYKVFDEKNAESLTGIASPNEIPETYELLFFGRNAIGATHQGYALFRDKSSGKRYLYTLTFATDFTYPNPITAITEIPSSFDMNQASLYAMNEENARLIYFVANNQVYLYDIDQQKETPVSAERLADGEITYLSNRYWNQADDKDNNFNHLCIGTYKNGEYQICLYNMLGGLPKGAPERILKGSGKAVKVQFSSPKMTDNPSNGIYYPVSF